MKEILLKEKENESPFDGRLIRKEDDVQNIYFFSNAVNAYVNRKGYIRIVGPDHKILVDFDDEILQKDCSVEPNYIIFLNHNGLCNVIDYTGTIRYSNPNTESFDVTQSILSFKCICDDGINRLRILSLEDLEVLTDIDEDMEEFKYNRNVIYSKFVGQEGHLQYGREEFNHGLDLIEDVTFLGDAVVITGYKKKKILNRIFINNKLVGDIYAPVTLRSGHNGEIEIIVDYGRRTEKVLFNSEGEMLERFKDGKGEFIFYDTGVLSRNTKNNRCMFISGDGVPVYTYDQNFKEVCYHSDSFNVATRNYSPTKISNLIMNGQTDFDLMYHVDPKKVPLSYLNNAYSVYYKPPFIIIQKAYGQKHFEYDYDSERFCFQPTYYFSTIVLNRNLKLVLNRAESLSSGKNTITCPFETTEMAISFLNEDGSKTYYDEEGNSYDYEPIIGSNGEIYIYKDDCALPYKIPGLSQQTIDAYKNGEAQLIKKEVEQQDALLNKRLVKDVVNFDTV